MKCQYFNVCAAEIFISRGNAGITTRIPVIPSPSLQTMSSEVFFYSSVMFLNVISICMSPE